MKKNKKHITIAIILIIVASLAFGYAYLTTTLTISGVTDIDRNNWDVYFDNIQVTDGSVTGSQVIDEAEIVDDTTVSFHVNLKKPGDFYEFTVEARNDGTIDAMIESVSKKLNGAEITTLPAYLNYTVTYADGIEIRENQMLAAESLETFKIRVEFKMDISAGELPSTAQSLTLSFGTEYVQADTNAQLIRRIAYYVGDINNVYSEDTYLIIGNSIPNGIVLYDAPEEAITAMGYSTFAKILIEDNILKSVSLGYGYNNEIYYVGKVSTAEEFDEQKQDLASIFGASNCTARGSSFNCCDIPAGRRVDVQFNPAIANYNLYEVLEQDTITEGIIGGCGYHYSLGLLCKKYN